MRASVAIEWSSPSTSPKQRIGERLPRRACEWRRAEGTGRGRTPFAASQGDATELEERWVKFAQSELAIGRESSPRLASPVHTVTNARSSVWPLAQ